MSITAMAAPALEQDTLPVQYGKETPIAEEIEGAPVLKKQVRRLAGVDNDNSLVMLDRPSERG